jgi:integrase
MRNRLLNAASPRIYRLIVAALETGCRLGELLALRWQDVDLERREILVKAENAKDVEDRVLPISTRLEAVLDSPREGASRPCEHQDNGHVPERDTDRAAGMTINRKAEVVVQDAEAYQELLERVETIEGLQRGVADIKAERTKPARDVFNRLRRKHGIPR